MKAAYITETGPAEAIVYGELPTPTPQGRQVLVRVGAVSVNPVDTYIRSGLVKMDLPSPFIVGCDFAGVVEAAGPDASDFEPGMRVWGSNQGLLGRQGTFAEFVCVDECWLYPTPPQVSDEQAAAMALVGITAHLGLVRDARLERGETILVNGGSGGVGSTVVQMARLLGARVIATVGSPAKAEAVLNLGADHAIVYADVEVPAALKKIAPAGVNVWWETTREPDFDRIVGSLAPRGRIVIMAGREARPPFPVGPFYVKGCSLHGFVMFMAHPDEQRDCADDINDWLARGQLKPKIDRVLPLAETAAAHRLQEQNTIGKTGTLAGKIVLKPA
ncbi:MAG: NADPH:quinone reductase [Verrucomicrobia bacterium]|nr:NADPH:quinone reductase [Verrucomicrobiota bacterium]